MKHYYFIEDETGEEFLVGANTLYEARMTAFTIALRIAQNYGIDNYHVTFQYEMDDDEAEASGLDEY